MFMTAALRALGGGWRQREILTGPVTVLNVLLLRAHPIHGLCRAVARHAPVEVPILWGNLLRNYLTFKIWKGQMETFSRRYGPLLCWKLAPLL